MKRIPRPRKIRDTILIITNGKQTEKNYFNSITNNFKSMFTIKVEFKNKQCDELIQYALSLNSYEYNQIWCVFDIDDSLNEGHLLSALELSRNSNIKIAFSNESFEVWLLYHLSKTVNPSLTRKNYIKEINKQLQNNGITKNFQKNDIELLKNYFIPNILSAAENSKKVYQKLEAEHQKQFNANKNYPIWNWKSISTVYKLIECLQLRPKDEK